MVYIRIQAEADVTLLVDEFLKMEIFRQEQAASFVCLTACLFVCLCILRLYHRYGASIRFS